MKKFLLATLLSVSAFAFAGDNRGIVNVCNLTEPFLEFITGTASVKLEVQEGQPVVSFGAETNLRS